MLMDTLKVLTIDFDDLPSKVVLLTIAMFTRGYPYHIGNPNIISLFSFNGLM